MGSCIVAREMERNEEPKKLKNFIYSWTRVQKKHTSLCSCLLKSFTGRCRGVVLYLVLDGLLAGSDLSYRASVHTPWVVNCVCTQIHNPSLYTKYDK